MLLNVLIINVYSDFFLCKNAELKNDIFSFCRTESVVEKMLTNWMALCMYNYIKVIKTISIFATFFPFSPLFFIVPFLCIFLFRSYYISKAYVLNFRNYFLCFVDLYYLNNNKQFPVCMYIFK